MLFGISPLMYTMLH